MSVRIVLADDHRIILEGLEQLFRRERDFQVLATCTNGEEALAAVQLHRPDVLVLDVQMPRLGGLGVLKKIHEDETLQTRVVLLTASLEEDQVLEALQHGVWGLVLKESAATSLVQCVRTVARGERLLDPTTVGRALDKIMRRQKAMREVAQVLSPRETEIVRMVAVGLRNKEIASRLFIGEGTVKSHLHSIYEKLSVHGRVELTLYAQERGIV
jgi:two-component system, NarL family, nitrate/nitrite response regulator NarL